MESDRALVVGLGSAGRRHIRTLRKLRPRMQVFALASRGARGLESTLVESLDAEQVFSYDEARSLNCELVLFCNPATCREQAVRELIQAPTAVFLEKPISHDLPSATRISQIISDSSSRAMIGYNLRFLPSLIEFRAEVMDMVAFGEEVSATIVVGQDLKQWRPGRDLVSSVSAQRALGGGVLNELSHEIDYAIWLFGQPISVIASLNKFKYFNLDVEDTACIKVDFHNEPKGNFIKTDIRLDFTSSTLRRFCEVSTAGQRIRWDGVSSRILKSRVNEPWTVAKKYSESRDSSFERELDIFLSGGSDDVSHIPGVEDALQVMRVIDVCRVSDMSGSARLWLKK